MTERPAAYDLALGIVTTQCGLDPGLPLGQEGEAKVCEVGRILDELAVAYAELALQSIAATAKYRPPYYRRSNYEQT